MISSLISLTLLKPQYNYITNKYIFREQYIYPTSLSSAESGAGISVVPDNKNTENSWMEHIALMEAFRALGDREKQILSMRFYDGKTQMEVAGLVGISQAQVSRLEKNAISAMRKKVMVS